MTRLDSFSKLILGNYAIDKINGELAQVWIQQVDKPIVSAIGYADGFIVKSNSPTFLVFLVDCLLESKEGDFNKVYNLLKDMK